MAFAPDPSTANLPPLLNNQTQEVDPISGRPFNVDLRNQILSMLNPDAEVLAAQRAALQPAEQPFVNEAALRKAQIGMFIGGLANAIVPQDSQFRGLAEQGLATSQAQAADLLTGGEGRFGVTPEITKQRLDQESRQRELGARTAGQIQTQDIARAGLLERVRSSAAQEQQKGKQLSELERLNTARIKSLEASANRNTVDFAQTLADIDQQKQIEVLRERANLGLGSRRIPDVKSAEFNIARADLITRNIDKIALATGEDGSVAFESSEIQEMMKQLRPDPFLGRPANPTFIIQELIRKGGKAKELGLSLMDQTYDFFANQGSGGPLANLGELGTVSPNPNAGNGTTPDENNVKTLKSNNIIPGDL